MLNKKRKAALRAALFALAGAAVLFCIVSCDQTALFADISNEVAPTVPRIPGSQTNIVIAAEENGERYIYVAGINSKKIHRYRGGNWAELDSPGGSMAALASAGGNLYALAGEDIMKADLYIRYNGIWKEIGKGDAREFSLQSIYGAGDMLFAGGRNGMDYDIFYFDNSTVGADGTVATALKSITGGTGLSWEAELKGAAASGTGYYIAAGRDGIFNWNGSSPINSNDEENPNNAIAGSTADNVTGIMDVSGQIMAVTWGGAVLKLEDGTFTSVTTGPVFTGAMAVWNNYFGSTAVAEGSLLLLGVHSKERFNKGYREMSIETPGNVSLPGVDEVSSVDPLRKYQYDASVARFSIYSIMQVPGDIESQESDLPQVIFATTVEGLHSMRYNARNGIVEWNAEK